MKRHTHAYTKCMSAKWNTKSRPGLKLGLAQSSGAVEYAECISTEEKDPTQWLSGILH